MKDENDNQQKRRLSMKKFTGIEAIEYARVNDLTLNKYADPTEDARSGLTPEEAEDVAAEDPSLIWLEIA